MKKTTYIKLYYFWIIFSLIICGFILMLFYPDYENTEFPLFIDFVLLMYIPILFAFSSILSHLCILIIGNKAEINNRNKLIIRLSIFLISFVFSLTLMEFRMGIRIIISIISIIFVLPFSIVTEIIYRNMIQ